MCFKKTNYGFWIFFLLLVIIRPLSGQDETDFQTWTDFTTFYHINEKWIYNGDYGIRGLVSNFNWTQAYIHPAFIYRVRAKLRFRGGVRFIFSQEADESNTFEMRPWQGIRILWPDLNFMIIDHYFRIEERLTWQTQSGSFDGNLRLRYRLEGKSANYTVRAINQTFYFLASFEIFANAGKAVEETYVNRNRLVLGVGYLISKKFFTELHYIRQGSRAGSEDGFRTSENILRLRLKMNLNRAKN
jgi:hypothetical protein